ncbi:hypothetical protein ACS0TY_011430 [Phlomoides rotata]
MGDLHSIAFSSSCKLHRSSLGLAWDLHNLGVFKADMSQYRMERSSDDDGYSSFADFSTGYLQDVLFDFTSKRRKLQQLHTCNSIENSWTSNLIQNCYDNTLSLTHTISDVKTPEEANSENYDSSSPDQKDNLYCLDPIFASGPHEKRKKRALAKVVYPFALVKPGGFEGDATLNDINERILMPPSRAVRHPVGDFACRPLVSPDGPGLSGKAVVAFTKIQTRGRGTITIIRTRG